MRVVIGCDVGGSSVKAGVITADGELLAKKSIPTGAIVDEAAFVEVVALFNDVLAEAGCASDDLCGIGIDMPGAVLPDGTHYMHFNIDIDAAGLRAAIARAFPQACADGAGEPDVLRIPCVNDANAAALG
ncbi:MAG: ROK family protein, partial [Atopobiaceae bacterium]|nr:ROK family protein [Atopobiaceae bacterium]